MIDFPAFEIDITSNSSDNHYLKAVGPLKTLHYVAIEVISIDLIFPLTYKFWAMTHELSVTGNNF